MTNQLVSLWARLSYFIFDFKFYLLIFGAIFLLGIILLLLKRTRLTLAVVASIYTLTFIFALAEFYYRYIFDATDNVYYIKTTQRWIQRHVVWNGNGYRDDHFWQQKDPRETRILFLGDSYTFGYGLKDSQHRYSELLGQKLASSCPQGKTLKTYNLGLPGNQSQTYLKQLSAETSRFLPDAVIIEYFLDDIGADALPDQVLDFAQVIYSYKQKPIIGFLLHRSYALEYLYIRLAGLFSSSHDWSQFINFNQTLYRDPNTWQRHLSTLQKIITTAQSQRLPLAVFILPQSHRLGANYPLTDIHQQLVKFFTDQKVPVVDLLPILNQSPPQQIMVS